MKPIHTLALLLSISLPPLMITANAQNLFINGGLEGPIEGMTPPSDWSAVSYETSFCEANSALGATPDTNGTSGPYSDIAGKPHSGSSFVSGLYMSNIISGFDYHFQEGIQQSVNLSAGSTYRIDLWQAVVKQQNALATTGQWLVYVGNTLLWTTDTTTSNLGWDKKIAGNTDLGWDARSFTFTASTSGATMISFLPYTPGGMQSDPDGLRMGIDDISLTVVPEPSGMMLLGSVGMLSLLRRKRCSHQAK